MPITLLPATQSLLADQMKRRGYRSPDDLVVAALAMLDEQDQLAHLPPDDLDAVYPGFREKIARGLAEAKAGKLTDGEEFFRELEREEEEIERNSRKTA
jgi:hypothetical protein